jgi:quercetin dioxygenase-like cupin family protein
MAAIVTRMAAALHGRSAVATRSSTTRRPTPPAGASLDLACFQRRFDVSIGPALEAPMNAVTPMLKDQETLDPLASRYVNVDSLPWKPTQYPGVDIKILLQDETTGLMTALFRWAPGAVLPLHEHVEIEQTYVIEGSIVDDEGEATKGNFVWRPAGNRHVAKAPNGALVLGMFLKPNKFLSGDFAGQSLK